MISVENLSKRYGDVVAVDDISFEVPPGRVTGFLGPNGAGKSTTMRMILGLDTPSSGSATIAGKAYRDLDNPTRYVGALLNPEAVHVGRTARSHLKWVAQAAAADSSRIDEMLEFVGIAEAADRRIGQFSLGMRQRLGIASALINDPEVLILDEPLNGLDPQGIVWVRDMLKERAARGGTVFVSSHLMNEMEETADQFVVIARGKLIANLSLAQLTAQATGAVRVVASDSVRLAAALERAGAGVERRDDALMVHGLDSRQVGEVALFTQVPLTELVPERSGLEAAFIELTKGAPAQDLPADVRSDAAEVGAR